MAVAGAARHRVPEGVGLLPEKVRLRLAVAREDCSVGQRPVHAKAVERYGQAQRSRRERDMGRRGRDLGRDRRPGAIVEPRAARPVRVGLTVGGHRPGALLSDLAAAQQRDPDEVVGERDDPHRGAVAAIEGEAARVAGGEGGAKDGLHLSRGAPIDRPRSRLRRLLLERCGYPGAWCAGVDLSSQPRVTRPGGSWPRQNVSPRFRSIVISALRDQEPIIRRPIDKTVLLRQAPRPPAGQAPAKRLGLSGPGERRARAFLDESVQAREQPGIIRLPVEGVLPGALAEDELHSGITRSIPPPLSSSTIASMSRPAFLALRSR